MSRLSKILWVVLLIWIALLVVADSYAQGGKIVFKSYVDSADGVRMLKSDSTYINTKINAKQSTLVSGTNIKAPHGQSLLGAGDFYMPTGTDPRWYGATTGGDIGAVINTIIGATTSPVYITIPEGTWNLSTTIHLPTDGSKTVIIRGASRDRSVIHAAATLETLIEKDTSTDTRSHVLESFTISCNRTSNWGVKLDGAINAKVDVRIVSPLIGGLQITGHSYETEISLNVENYSALIDTSQRPDYGLYIAPGSTDMLIHKVIAYNVRKTGVYDDGAANTYSYVHTYGSPQPLFNPQYSMDVRNGAQIKWLYSDGVTLAPVHIRGNNVTFNGGKFFWQYVRMTAASGSTGSSVNVASISGSTPTIPAGTVLNFSGTSVSTTSDVTPTSGAFSIPVLSGGGSVVAGNTATFKTCPASTVSTFEIESGLTNLVLMAPTIEGDNGNATQRQIGTAPTFSSMLQNRSDRTGFTALDILRVKQGNSSAGGALHVESSTGTQALVSFQSGNGSQRWTLGKNGVAESGSNVGADFLVNRYNDAGTFVDAPLSVTRSTGNTNILYSAFVGDSIYNSKLSNRLNNLQAQIVGASAIDSFATDNSYNLVFSNGIYDALATKLSKSDTVQIAYKDRANTFAVKNTLTAPYSTRQLDLGGSAQGGVMGFVSGATGTTDVTIGYNSATNPFFQIAQTSSGGIGFTTTGFGGFVQLTASGANGAINLYTGSSINQKMFISGNTVFQKGGTFTDIPTALTAVNSTTQGFLPPRMTTTQRDAISSPATGLVIFCTDCTSTDGSTGTLQGYNGAWKNAW